MNPSLLGFDIGVPDQQDKPLAIKSLGLLSVYSPCTALLYGHNQITNLAHLGASPPRVSSSRIFLRVCFPRRHLKWLLRQDSNLQIPYEGL